MSEADEFAALLDGVYARRRAELLERADALVRAVHGWSADEPGCREQAAAEAHRLAGGLGTLGFDGLSDDARALERRAAAAAAAGVVEQTTAEALLAALRAAEQRPA